MEELCESLPKSFHPAKMNIAATRCQVGQGAKLELMTPSTLVRAFDRYTMEHSNDLYKSIYK